MTLPAGGRQLLRRRGARQRRSPNRDAQGPGSPGVEPGRIDALARRAGERGLVFHLVDAPAGGDRAREYRVHLQHTLGGGVDVVRQWGRLGHLHKPRRLVTHHDDEEATHPVLIKVVIRRLARGYKVAG